VQPGRTLKHTLNNSIGTNVNLRVLVDIVTLTAEFMERLLTLAIQTEVLWQYDSGIQPNRCAHRSAHRLLYLKHHRL